MVNEYQLEFLADDKHIDFQGIMDGLYYPHYMEKCRHRFVKEVLGIDLKEWAEKGVNIVLSQYLLRYRRPLHKGDRFSVTCASHPDAQNKSRFHIKQNIIKDGKIVADAVFTATCVPANGGRAFLPDELREKLIGEPFDSSNNPEGAEFHGHARG